MKSPAIVGHIVFSCCFTVASALLPLVPFSANGGHPFSNSIRSYPTRHYLSEENYAEDNSANKIIPETFVMKNKETSDDLTDRFKYKVNALMGTFDPPVGKEDTEREQGNILSAILNFPVQYTFIVVGRTNGDTTVQSNYVDDVTRIISNATGEDPQTLQCEVTARGTKFTRVSVGVTVASASIISSIYEELANLQCTIMRY